MHYPPLFAPTLRYRSTRGLCFRKSESVLAFQRMLTLLFVTMRHRSKELDIGPCSVPFAHSSPFCPWQSPSPLKLGTVELRVILSEVIQQGGARKETYKNIPFSSLFSYCLFFCVGSTCSSPQQGRVILRKFAESCLTSNLFRSCF